MPFEPDAGAVTAETLADFWIIEPRQYGMLDRIRELWRYRYLLGFFASETINALLRRGRLGWFWLLMRASGPVGLNAIVFGGIAKIESARGVPYFLFLLCGMATWVMFERSLLFVTMSLERNRGLITKVYFPRLILPMAAVAPGLVYLVLLLLVMIGADVYFWYRDQVWYIALRPQLLASVLAIVMSLAFTISVGLWTSVLQVRYPDIRYGLRYLTQFWLYLTPILWPISSLKEWRWLAMINPMSHVVQLFKWGTLGVEGPTMFEALITVAGIAVTMVSGIWFFNRAEASSIDKL